MKVPEAVLEQAARAAYRRSFESAPEIQRAYRESDWEQTADEQTRQHFRELVRLPLEAALEQLREEFDEALMLDRPTMDSLAWVDIESALADVLGEKT